MEFDETVCLCEDHREQALRVLFKNPSHTDQKDFVRRLQIARNKRITETKYGPK
jgi:hypothetical protein